MSDTAWTYVAISTAKQTETVEDEAIVNDIAGRNGWTVTRRFGDDGDAVGSGEDGVRSLLLRLMAELEATPKRMRPRRIIMSRLDRVGRVAIDSMGAMAEIWRLGVILHDSIHGDLTFDNAFDVFRPVIGFATVPEVDRVRSGRTCTRAGALRACTSARSRSASSSSAPRNSVRPEALVERDLRACGRMVH